MIGFGRLYVKTNIFKQVVDDQIVHHRGPRAVGFDTDDFNLKLVLHQHGYGDTVHMHINDLATYAEKGINNVAVSSI